MDLHILNFNNYSDRIVKNPGNDLMNYVSWVLFTAQDYDFTEGDTVNTEVVVNSLYGADANYVIITEQSGQNNPVRSRWFVLSCTRIRGSQYKLKLRRDLMVDQSLAVSRAPAFIERGTLNDSDPYIFNSEGKKFNQIKTRETPMYDSTGVPWIVGYIGTDAPDTSINIMENAAADIDVTDLSAWKYYPYLNFTGHEGSYVLKPTTSRAIKIQYHNKTALENDTALTVQYGNGKYAWSVPSKTLSRYSVDRVFGHTEEIKQYTISRLASFSELINANFAEVSREKTPDFFETNLVVGTTIYDQATGKMYRVRSIARINDVGIDAVLDTNQLFNVLDQALSATPYVDFNSDIKEGYSIMYNGEKDMYNLEEVSTGTISTALKTTNLRLSDAPYKMFCAPYGNITFRAGDSVFVSKKETCQLISTKISEALGSSGGSSSFIYDLQILPYCPVINTLTKTGTLLRVPTNFIEDKNYTLIKKGNAAVGILFWANSSSFSFGINKKIPVTNRKVENETDLWRLTSPNYSGAFDFSAAKNGGVDGFTAYCTYKPYQPYIQIKPNFSNIYGINSEDARGLICGGEFSLPSITDAWKQYELNNKTYQNTFDREIQSIDTARNAARRSENMQMLQGALSIASSAGQFASTGNPMSMVSAGTSFAAGNVSRENNELLYRDTKDLKRDLFTYSLQNVQALPNSLTKVPAINFINKLVPILEYYTCTDQEKEAFTQELTWNGMTVMRPGRIVDYKDPTGNAKRYIQGRFLRLDDETGFIGNTLMANELNNELMKGVYI